MIVGIFLKNVVRQVPVVNDGFLIDIITEGNFFGLKKDRSRTTLDNPVVINMEKNELNEIIQETLYATSKDEMKISLQGVCINVKKKQIIAVATDGFRLVKRISKTKKENKFNGQVIIPTKFLTVLQSDQPV